MLLCEATNKRPELIERHGVERQQLEQVDLKAARGDCRLAALWRSLGGGALWSIRVVCRCRVLRLHRHLNEVRRVNIVHRLTDARGCGEAVVQGVGTAHLQRDRDSRERNAQQLARQLAHLERCGNLASCQPPLTVRLALRLDCLGSHLGRPCGLKGRQRGS